MILHAVWGSFPAVDNVCSQHRSHLADFAESFAKFREISKAFSSNSPVRASRCSLGGFISIPGVNSNSGAPVVHHDSLNVNMALIYPEIRPSGPVW